MSDIYIPELIELDSYWQKAVEDAIYDTLKGEKRLYYALRNRKKINEKLEKLGLKPLYSQMSFSPRCNFSAHSFDSDRENSCFDKCPSTSYTEWDSQEDKSDTSSLGSLHDEEASWKEPPPSGRPKSPSFSPLSSKSPSKHRKETPPEKIYRNPERPILGNGSLEKMKKSQNSFYCEPMGTEGGATPQTSYPAEGNNPTATQQPRPHPGNDPRPRESDKKLQWLHFRQGEAFRDSDTEMSIGEDKTVPTTSPDPRHTSFKSSPERRFSSQRWVSGPVDSQLPTGATTTGRRRNHERRRTRKTPKREEVPMTLDPREDLFWENEVKSAIRKNAGLERKLYFALAKRDIVNKSLRDMNVAKENRQIKIRESEARVAAKRRQGKKVLSPYIKFYLEVYRELCHKASVKQIAQEAASRWWRKSLTQKTNH